MAACGFDAEVGAWGHVRERQVIGRRVTRLQRDGDDSDLVLDPSSLCERLEHNVKDLGHLLDNHFHECCRHLTEGTIVVAT
jgi:hypothetical protein